MNREFLTVESIQTRAKKNILLILSLTRESKHFKRPTVNSQDSRL